MNPTSRALLSARLPRQMIEGLGWFLVPLILLAVQVLVAPHSLYHAGWLYGDQSWYLTQLDQLMRGGRLYEDVATPYGPIPYLWHLLLAKVFGNTVQVFIWGQAVVLALATMISWFGLRKILPLKLAVWGMCLGVLPFQIKAVGMLIYEPWTILQLSLVVLLWNPPGQGKPSNSLWLGILLGLGQLIKFGHFAMFGAGIAVADLLTLYHQRPASSQLWKKLICHWLVIGLGFAAIEGPLLTWLFGTLPYPIAFDAAWPSYQKLAYGTFGPDEKLWGGLLMMPWQPFVARILPSVLIVIASVTALWNFLGKRSAKARVSEPSADPALFAFCIPVAGYITGCFILFTATVHPWSYYWMLGWSIPWVWSFSIHSVQLYFRTLCVGCALLTPVGWFAKSKSSFVRLEMPDSSVLYVTPDYVTSWKSIQQFDQEHLPKGSKVQFLRWYGLNHYLNHAPPGRHAYPLVGWVRPYDSASIQEQVKTCWGIITPRHRSNDSFVGLSGEPLKRAIMTWTQLPEPYLHIAAEEIVSATELEGWLIMPMRAKDRVKP